MKHEVKIPDSFSEKEILEESSKVSKISKKMIEAYKERKEKIEELTKELDFLKAQMTDFYSGKQASGEMLIQKGNLALSVNAFERKSVAWKSIYFGIRHLLGKKEREEAERLVDRATSSSRVVRISTPSVILKAKDMNPN